jgi:transcriptional regulator with XRE-family HTH domain
MKLTSSTQNRKLAGTWLKGLRIESGLTQQELARRLRFRYYTFISQVENGFTRVPTDKMEQWAIELGIDPTRFARQLLSFYEPELYRLLYTRARAKRRAVVAQKSSAVRVA